MEAHNNNDRLSGIFAKLAVYAFRFALIYQVSSWACDEADKVEIDDNAMHSAIQTCEYFKMMALKVNPIDYEIKLPMSTQKQEIYKALPKEFTTGEGVKIGLQYNLPERTFKTWLTDESLFANIKYGLFSKLL